MFSVLTFYAHNANEPFDLSALLLHILLKNNPFNAEFNQRALTQAMGKD
ncbi:hypothetical protein [Shewanella baltica]|nr:hypothetical protein [Shewanella baltica]MCS6173464.1 hypothetical protein [Shewanella baltica]